MFKYNKGEWSEIYTFTYLLSTGILYSADRDLNILENVYFPIVKIIREEIKDEKIDYCVGNKIKIYKGEELLGEVDKEKFEETTNILLAKIPEGTRAFEIPEVEDFFNTVFVTKVKENSDKKEDITLQIEDIHTGITTINGFSIKSYLGANPTLVNAGKNTNFEFVVENCNDSVMNAANSTTGSKKLVDRMTVILENGCDLMPIEHSISRQFETNLMFVDSFMPKHLQLMVLYSYKYSLTKVKDVIEKLKEDNPMNYPVLEMYEYKTKKLFCAFALGLMPESKDWLGAEDANGGYITVRADGKVVCYHIYNRTEFEEYLLNYSYFERASTSRHEYFAIYKDDDGLYKVKLNLQIRFKQNG